ncbi:MAG: D-aminoacyl-tRNA deacylase [Bacteroidetes bacterium]|nr:D-aminoacyl-tRNA deacylase [Bacteroidota bacterium]
MNCLCFLGIEHSDTEHGVDYLLSKCFALRIFSDDNRKMNLSLLDKNFQLMIVSQFTLHALTKKENRPSFISSAKPDVAINLYESYVAKAIQEKINGNNKFKYIVIQ